MSQQLYTDRDTTWVDPIIFKICLGGEVVILNCKIMFGCFFIKYSTRSVLFIYE